VLEHLRRKVIEVDPLGAARDLETLEIAHPLDPAAVDQILAHDDREKLKPGRTCPLSATIRKSIPDAIELKKLAAGVPMATSSWPVASAGVILAPDAKRSVCTAIPFSPKLPLLDGDVEPGVRDRRADRPS